MITIIKKILEKIIFEEVIPYTKFELPVDDITAPGMKFNFWALFLYETRWPLNSSKLIGVLISTIFMNNTLVLDNPLGIETVKGVIIVILYKLFWNEFNSNFDVADKVVDLVWPLITQHFRGQRTANIFCITPLQEMSSLKLWSQNKNADTEICCEILAVS